MVADIDMVADIMTNKKFQATMKELFIRCRKLNISLIFITESYFKVSKDVRLNSTIAFNHSTDIDCKVFLKTYRNCTKEPYSLLTIDITLLRDNHMRFRKDFSDSPL